MALHYMNLGACAPAEAVVECVDIRLHEVLHGRRRTDCGDHEMVRSALAPRPLFDCRNRDVAGHSRQLCRVTTVPAANPWPVAFQVVRDQVWPEAGAPRLSGASRFQAATQSQ